MNLLTDKTNNRSHLQPLTINIDQGIYRSLNTYYLTLPINIIVRRYASGHFHTTCYKDYTT